MALTPSEATTIITHRWLFWDWLGLTLSILFFPWYFFCRKFFGESLLWLRNLDGASHLVPKRLLCLSFSNRKLPEPICIVRPGGLGDLVILTRACLEQGIDLNQITWFVEKRNAVWLEYLRVPYNFYDSGPIFLKVLLGNLQYSKVINSEQTYGLSALFARRIAAAGKLYGFTSNSRSDLYDHSLPYDIQSKSLLEDFKVLLNAATLASSSNLYQAMLDKIKRTEVQIVVAIAGLDEPSKRIGIHAWRLILNRACRFQLPVILVGKATEKYFADQLAAEYSSKVTNLVGKLEFPEVVSHICSAKYLISVDSGLVHVADFFGVATEVVFCGASVCKWKPQHPKARVLLVNELLENTFQHDPSVEIDSGPRCDNK